jgi:hypothetical protein
MRTLVTDDLRKTLRALAEKPQWLAWKAGPKDPRTGKFSKYPFNIYTGKNATGSHEDGAYLENCGTLDQAQAGIKKYNLDGLGFVVTRQDSIVAVDIDRCLEGGEITPGVKQIVECFDSYTEISPSGKGLRIFCFGKLPKGAISNPPGTPYEIYDCNKFLTVTGNVYGELRPVKENQEAVNWFCENVTGFHGDGSKGSNDDRPKAESVLKGVPEGQRDEWLFRYACRLRAKNMGREEAETLVSIAARNCEPPFPTQEALSKVDQAWKNYKPGETGATYGKIPKVCLGYFSVCGGYQARTNKLDLDWMAGRGQGSYSCWYLRPWQVNPVIRFCRNYQHRRTMAGRYAGPGWRCHYLVR